MKMIAFLTAVFILAGMPTALLAQDQSGKSGVLGADENQFGTLRGGVCTLFDTEANFVDFDLWLDLQDMYVRLRFPSGYVDNPKEYQRGEPRRTTLIRVDVNTFEPISRYEDHLRFKAGNYDSMSILFSDRVPLEKQARIHANLATRKSQNLNNEHQEIPGPYGLLQLEYQSQKDKTFVARNSSGEITDVFSCNAVSSVPLPHCSQMFKFNGINIKASYLREYLMDWTVIHTRIETFLQCASDRAE